VTVASGGLIASLAFLASFDLETERIIADKEEVLRSQMARMEGEYRRITKNMGFNVLILPKDQNLSDFYAENYADKFMPEAYARELADAKKIVTIRHLLPMLQQKLEWPEQKRKILLIGVRGEMPWAHRNNLKPLLKPVPPGMAALGHELARGLNIEVGNVLTFMGKSFEVTALHPERGTIDDITLWIDLREAQALLGQEGLINSMLALECKCAWADLPEIRREIQAVLPNTQVVELAGKALARAEARREAEKNAKLAIEREKQGREKLRTKREELMAAVIPLIIVGCAVWVGLLALANVRERRVEIGTLRALGIGTMSILAIFLGKAALLGAVGAGFGVAVSLCLCSLAGIERTLLMLGAAPVVLVLLLAPVITVLASWIPALYAARQDPAEILREE